MREAVSSHRTAGGVVINAEGQLLVIVRDIEREGEVRHEVRLPKGHIDPGEEAEAAALREVCEESGYCHCEIIADLGEYRSEYRLNGRPHARDERYFLMRLTDPTRQAPVPTNEEEALFAPEWIPAESAHERITYPSEKIFAQRAVAAWKVIKGSS
jgi:8-oxo-dGTP pyrophosphatase MutT (NUDIX family)